jgi:hypothetical protein
MPPARVCGADGVMPRYGGYGSVGSGLGATMGRARGGDEQGEHGRRRSIRMLARSFCSLL